MSFIATLDLGAMGECQVVVVYKFYPGFPGSMEEPPEPRYCEVTRVIFSNELDILDLLNDECVAELTEMAMERHDDELACGGEDWKEREYAE